MSVARPIARELPASLPSRELQELWFATRRRDWVSLAVVPASPGASAMRIAQALGEVGGTIRMNPVQVINAENLDLSRIATLAMDVASLGIGRPPAGPSPSRAAAAGPALIVAVEPVVTNPLALPIALAADAVLLCVELGTTELSAARHTIEMIGRDRLLGAVLLKP